MARRLRWVSFSAVNQWPLLHLYLCFSFLIPFLILGLEQSGHFILSPYFALVCFPLIFPRVNRLSVYTGFHVVCFPQIAIACEVCDCPPHRGKGTSNHLAIGLYFFRGISVSLVSFKEVKNPIFLCGCLPIGFL